MIKYYENNEFFLWWDDLTVFDKVPEKDPLNLNPLKLTLRQLIKRDIASNIDSTGYSKHREALKILKIITESDVNKWNIKQAEILPEDIRKNLESLSVNP